MKILIIVALVSVASAYNSYINIAGRNVIGEGRGSLSKAALSSLRSGGKGLSGSVSSVSPVKKLAQISSRPAYQVPQVIAPAPIAQVAAPAPEYISQEFEAAPQFALASPQLSFSPVQQQSYSPVQQLSYSAAPQLSLSSLASASPISQAYDVAPAGGVITAAVQTRYRIQYVDVPSTGGRAQPQQIVIPANAQPLEISFESQSSPVTVRQVHIPGRASEPQFSSHQEEPDILKQEIVKPIIQEITEAIQPIRKIVQEVRPVQETINQILSRGEQVQSVQSAQVAAPVRAIAAPVQVQPQISVQAVRPVAQIAVARPVQTIASPVFSKPIGVSFVTRPTLGLSKPSSAALAGFSRPAQSFGGSIIGSVLPQTQQIEQSLIDKKKKAAA